MHNFDWYEHTAFFPAAVTAVAADFAIPQPPSIVGVLGPSIDRVDDLKADELELTAPALNPDVLYVDLERTAAVATGKPIRPGETRRFSGASKTTLSAIMASGSGTLEITAFFR